MPRRLSLILIAVAMCGSAHAQDAVQTPAAALAEEFPGYEDQLLGMLQRGARSAAAARSLSREPDSVETLTALISQDRIDEAIGVVRRILTRRPELAADALKAVASQSYKFTTNSARGYADALQEIAAQARVLAARLSREQGARVARQALMIERRQPSAPGVNAYVEGLEEFLREYDGTEEALLTQVDLLERGRASWAQVQALDDFVRAHPRSIPAAKALYVKGQQIGVNLAITGVEPRGSDPTERFLRVAAIVRELESGDYPKCDWVDRAPQLITGFFASNPTFAPGNADRLAAEYVAFARTHLTFGSPDPGSNGAGYLVTAKLAEIYKSEGDPVAAVERALSTLWKETARPEFAFLTASFYLRTAVNDTAQRTAMREKAKQSLRSLSQAGSDVYHRKALATLACLEFEDREYPSALEHFSDYVDRYRASPYAWVASFRVGASQESLGDLEAAAAAYRSAAADYGTNPVAQVIGHEYAGRALEGLDKLEDARREHESALRAWDPNYGDEYTLNSRDRFASRPAIFEPVAPITRDALSQRIRQLRAWLAHPSGRLAARGQWLLEHERRADAVDTLRRLLRQFPRSPLIGQARSLLHHAQLELALEQANVESTDDTDGAFRQLTELAREPYDATICVAGIARATLLAGSSRTEADATMRATLTQCRTQGMKVRPRTASALEADVLAVRDAVFLPSGGGVYGTRGWNAFTWPPVEPPFLLVDPAITVKTSDGVQTRVVLRDRFAAAGNVVFFTADQIHLLNGVMTALGGTKKFVPASIMATPNQPAGPAVDIQAFWNRFFPCRPGHWGGWEFEAYPRIGSIQFLDAARTKAAVPVTIGYSGGTVVLEKQSGVWRALRLTDPWIT